MARMTPLGDDSQDKGYFINGPKEFGHPSYGMHVPMFYTRYGNPIALEGAYQGGACFLVSNGPSLKNLDLEKLKHPGIMVYSINNGASTLLANGITPNFWSCVDQPSRFIKQIWLNPSIQKIVPFTAFDKPLWDNTAWKPLRDTAGVDKPMHCPNVVGFRRNEKFAAHRFFTESSINWGCHKKWGGCRSVLLPAIRIPYLMGFRRLYLLGVDLNMSKTQTYHFNEGRTDGAVRNNQNTYKRIIGEYGPGIKKYADKLNYHIYNCNDKSALTCFPFKDFNEAIDHELNLIGLKEPIVTEGMYLEWDKKVGATFEEAKKLTGAVG